MCRRFPLFRFESIILVLNVLTKFKFSRTISFCRRFIKSFIGLTAAHIMQIVSIAHCSMFIFDSRLRYWSMELRISLANTRQHIELCHHTISDMCSVHTISQFILACNRHMQRHISACRCRCVAVFCLAALSTPMHFVITGFMLFSFFLLRVFVLFTYFLFCLFFICGIMVHLL